MFRSTSFLQCCTLLLACLPLLGAADPSLQSFDVKYRYSAGVKTAEVRVSLQAEQAHWLWRTEVSPASFLALFSNERLFTNTRFSIENGQPRIKNIELGSDSIPQPTETAMFNWSDQQMESSRKGKQRRLPLMQPVYDSNTIHLLAQELYFSAKSTDRSSFYYKGKLTSVLIDYEGLTTIDLNGKTRQTELFSVRRQGSDTMLLYYYEPGEMLYPLRIEHRDPEESTVVMTLIEE